MNDNGKIKDTEHRAEDPAEGARDIIDHELKRQDDKAGQKAAAGKPADRSTNSGRPH